MRILVVLDRPDTVTFTLEVAGQLADRFACRDIRLLHPQLEDDPDFRAPDEGMPTREDRLRFARSVSDRADRLRAACADWITASGRTATARWIEIAGDVQKIVAREAANADLTVLSRPRPKDPAFVGQAFTGALYDAQSTVVIAPLHHHPTVGARPVIAWRPSHALERAIASATPLLSRAEVVTWVIGEGGHGTVELPPVAAQLESRGVRTVVDRFTLDDGDPGEQIRAHALAAQADLLIMGSYTHPRFVEWLFGGPTRDILAHGTLPILTHH
ncbi:UspA domain protein [Gluconacetobacter diazotrophicus PA1 5]|nr:universal stress protein [Gluconacetobacter diazotrophicus]ACI52388.1 UspA domain protein [Gluconacetobacter diazotrophicus PA1 5]MBB2158081.1 universal stress protein [Gluconacetobacter diazotrophicus]TWB05515.1 nucleotide-binding universal stress UspA family protein [Gluconacetobacter diazotrophicus]